ncbi:hypothetical protein ASPBRDRAFT_50481 [Aspergillus brasiliensis CBS 101740]|uniref:Uncharacterized protein n=1 Tax=Aspergillus brasiliensis (strain CBS 101740 / IMI 381727 / IBT 21946) TaxID=767769 RepID=A0A1L9V0Y4_ASPBC|nr:hypothetical protein ASPBRDRAFT_50481 [Aspergillus brasiliensis CBS 101740]
MPPGGEKQSHAMCECLALTTFTVARQPTMPTLVWCAFEKSSRRGLGVYNTGDDGFRLRLADFSFLYRPMTVEVIWHKEEDFYLQIGARWAFVLVVTRKADIKLSTPSKYSNTTHLWLFLASRSLPSIKTEQPFNNRARSHMMAMTFPGAAYLEYALSRVHNQ